MPVMTMKILHISEKFTEVASLHQALDGFNQAFVCKFVHMVANWCPVFIMNIAVSLHDDMNMRAVQGPKKKIRKCEISMN